MSDMDFEHRTGAMWINDKPIYRKVVNFGALPGMGAPKLVAHNIDDLDEWVDWSVIVSDSSNVVPSGYTPTLNATICSISSAIDLTAYSAYFILEYTKTTD